MGTLRTKHIDKHTAHTKMFSLTSTVASAKLTSKVNFKTSRTATKARAGFSVNAAASGDTLDKVRGIISEQLGRGFFGHRRNHDGVGRTIRNHARRRRGREDWHRSRSGRHDPNSNRRVNLSFLFLQTKNKFSERREERERESFDARLQTRRRAEKRQAYDSLASRNLDL